MLDGIQTGVELPVTKSHRLRVRLWTVGVASLTAVVRAILRDSNGQTIEIVQPVTATRSTSPRTVSIPLTNAKLVAIAAHVPSGFTYNSFSYMDVKLQTGDNANDDSLLHLASGPVDAANGILWPIQQNKSNTEAWSFPIMHTTATPAAGASLSENLPTGVIFKIKAITAGFDSSATVANRQLRLSIWENGSRKWAMDARTVIAASQSVDILAAPVPQLPADSVARNLLYFHFPPDITAEAGTFEINVSGIQAGDQVYAAKIWAEVAVDIS